MPKGSIHHLHTSAAPPIGVYMEMTKEDIVYYNERDGLFKVFIGKEPVVDGYVSCKKMREEFAKDPDDYDKKLKDTILLLEHEYLNKESHDIWKDFQHKFTRVGGLCKYYKFFKIALKEIIDSCLRQNIFAVELRHISGMLFNDNHEPMSFTEELEIIHQIVLEKKKEVPYFELSLIITGLKILPGHINTML